MFVHLVEEGLSGSPEAELLVRYYLEGRPQIDTLILGCTHYPVLQEVIQRVVGPAVALVSSAEVAADMVKRELPPSACPPNGRTGRIVHYVTGDVLAYKHTAEVIGGVEGELIPLDVTTLSRQRPRLPMPPSPEHSYRIG